MSDKQEEGPLFIVDNSVSGWTGAEYLSQWCDISTSFDIATGFLEIGALLELDQQWQKLGKIRILMGDQVVHRTKKAFRDAITQRAKARLDASLEAEKGDNPFLVGTDAIVDALASRKIECRVYDEDKFHAKAYITHAKIDVVGAQALVGSSNFTRPGLTQNIELNIQIQSSREVAQLQEWYDHHWDEAVDVTPEMLEVVERHTKAYTPFDVYSKALHQLFAGHELSGGEWDETKSKMFPQLDRYQKEAYWALMKIARQHGGAFLCDGVGLGKTFVGLMLIERLVLHEGKRVLLFAPKAAKEGVWDPHLRQWLPHIGGIGGSADFSNLAVFSHTDLNRAGDFPARFERLAELADAVVIDEAHHFRNPGRAGAAEDEAGEEEVAKDRRSRYRRLFDLLDETQRQKEVFLLTATPINNRLADFRHMAELFTRSDDAYFARTLGVNNLTAHFATMEKQLQHSLGDDAASLQEGLLEEAHDRLAGDPVFRGLVVQRSRAYAKESQLQEKGTSVSFPDRRPPQVANYSIRKAYGHVLTMFEKAFERKSPLFALPIYYPLAFYTGPDATIDPVEENRQKQVVALIRTNFLKRFESSVYAFECSLDRLLRKLLAFVEVYSTSDADLQRYDRWKRVHAEVLGYHPDQQLDLFDDTDADEDVVTEEQLEAVPRLDPPEHYDLARIIDETYVDLEQIALFLAETRKFEPKKDDKLQRLVRLLKGKDMAGRKVLVFTEFADTARYVEHHLKAEGIEGVEELDSSSKVNRAEVIRRFSPYYNGSSSGELAAAKQSEIRVLISTDVLSEGLNLQDATRLVNYDIHWNPVRLMQRIGRVDRRMSAETEKRLVGDHPELAEDRGKVAYWNFLPPEDLNDLLSLYKQVTRKTLLISKTLGIEGKKLLTPDDDFEALKELNARYEGEKTVIEDLHLEYQRLIRADDTLEARLALLPGSVFSGRKRLAKGVRGVFFCYSLPAYDQEAEDFTLEAGTTNWYLYDLDSDTVLEDPGQIAASIRSKKETPRRCTMEQPALKDIRAKVLAHIKNNYLKRLDAPQTAPKPRLDCWMELNA